MKTTRHSSSQGSQLKQINTGFLPRNPRAGSAVQTPASMFTPSRREWFRFLPLPARSQLCGCWAFPKAPCFFRSASHSTVGISLKYFLSISLIGSRSIFGETPVPKAPAIVRGAFWPLALCGKSNDSQFAFLARLTGDPNSSAAVFLTVINCLYYPHAIQTTSSDNAC